MVSDNAAYFTSQEFVSYLELNAIRHTKSSPYHPSSNGFVERAVQSLKNGLKKVKEGTLEARIAKILFQYRITPHSTTGIAPAELLLCARPCSRMDALFPNTAVRQSRSSKRVRMTPLLEIILSPLVSLYLYEILQQEKDGYRDT